MYGTRDDQIRLIEHGYFVFETLRCTEATRKANDPPCATEPEIDAWLADKVMGFRIINQKIDFSTYDEVAVRNNEVWLPVVNLETGTFCDTGYRHRRNTFSRVDSWFIPTKLIQPFYDITLYNSDCFVRDPGNNPINELYFRFEVDQVSHTRIVIGFMDFVSALGGVSRILLSFVGFVYGGFASYHKTFATVAALYRYRKEDVNDTFAVSKQNDPKYPNV